MTTSVPESEVRVPLDANALRKIRRSWIKGRGGVKKAAFMPRENGNDRDGLSVSIETPDLAETHRAHFDSGSFCACVVSAFQVRNLTLEIVLAPEDFDPAHALITGIPDRTLGSEELARAERFAEKLAEVATEYRFPTP
jgi:hypothetical protein